MTDPTLFLAAADGELVMIVILGGLMLMVPIVAILTHHQRKMAEILHKKPGSEVLPALVEELRQLRQEVNSMRTEINANTIAVDDVRNQALPSGSRQELHSRMKEEH